MLGAKRTEKEMADGVDNLIPGLPYEIASLCIARVPRSYHHNMRGVCRSWRSFLRGEVFSRLRRELSLVEEWLYLWTETGNAWHSFDPSLRKWFRLPPMPKDNRIAGHSAFASLDGKLFVIGGNLLNFYDIDESYIPSKTVSYFDAASYSWKRAADLNIPKAKCMAALIDNKLYAFGGNIEGCKNITVTAEVYDSNTDSWKFISKMKCPVALCDSVVMGGKIFAVNSGRELSLGVVYDPQTDKWEKMKRGMHLGWDDKTTVWDGKLYSVGHKLVDDYLGDDGDPPLIKQVIRGYDLRKDVWKEVDILDFQSDTFPLTAEVELVNFGRKLCIITVGWIGNGDERVCVGTFEPRCPIAIEYDKDFEIRRNDFEIESTDMRLQMSREVKRCQIVAM